MMSKDQSLFIGKNATAKVMAKVKLLNLSNNSSYFLFDPELFFCINVMLPVFVQSVMLIFV